MLTEKGISAFVSNKKKKKVRISSKSENKDVASLYSKFRNAWEERILLKDIWRKKKSSNTKQSSVPSFNHRTFF